MGGMTIMSWAKQHPEKVSTTVSAVVLASVVANAINQPAAVTQVFIADDDDGNYRLVTADAVVLAREVVIAAGSRPVVIDLKDPACLVGRAVPWPEPALPEGISDREREDTGTPARRQGASVVLLEGRPVLHATERLRALTSYTADRAVLEAALTALVQHERELMGREERPPRRVVENLGGVPALDRGVSALLAQAGLEREPRGMVLRPDPYGRR